MFSCTGFLVSKKCPSGFASIAPSGIVGAIAPSGIVGAAAIVATTSTFVGAFAATASTVWIPRPTPPHCCESTNLALQPSHLTCNSWTDPDLNLWSGSMICDCGPLPCKFNVLWLSTANFQTIQICSHKHHTADCQIWLRHADKTSLILWQKIWILSWIGPPEG